MKGAAPVPVPEADKEAEMPEDENHLDYFLDTFLNEKWGLHYNVIEKYHNEWWFRCSRPGQLSYSLLPRQSFSSIPVDTFDIVSEYLRAIHTPRTCLIDRLKINEKSSSCYGEILMTSRSIDPTLTHLHWEFEYFTSEGPKVMLGGGLCRFIAPYLLTHPLSALFSKTRHATLLLLGSSSYMGDFE